MNRSDNPFIAFLAIITAPIAAGALLLSWAPSNHFFDFAPEFDGYVAARDISTTVGTVQDATLTVFCDQSDDRGSLGTAWAIDPEVLQIDSEKALLVTNHHVIEDCIKPGSKLRVAKFFGKKRDATLLTYDKKNDLALLEVDMKLEPLKLSENFMYSGYWVMSLGSAAGYEGSVSFGNIVNTTYDEVLFTNNISEGNSGGALIDNEGKVVGVITWGSSDEREQFNGAKSLDALCLKIIKCEFEYDGEKTWYDWND
jgi:S1-C subfamily serine protease